MSTTDGGPFPGSYWVERGRLLAGPYPEDVAPLLAVGVVATLDLTEPGEGWNDYWTAAPGLDHHRAPIEDFAVPSSEQMARTLATLDELVGRGAPVYLHCRGGRGRTGCVVGCYLVEHGASPEQALEAIRSWCGHDHSPETGEQRAFVRAWPGARPGAAGRAPGPASS